MYIDHQFYEISITITSIKKQTICKKLRNLSRVLGKEMVLTVTASSLWISMYIKMKTKQIERENN